jgi:hypothetical protein
MFMFMFFIAMVFMLVFMGERTGCRVFMIMVGTVTMVVMIMFMLEGMGMTVMVMMLVAMFFGTVLVSMLVFMVMLVGMDVLVGMFSLTHSIPLLLSLLLGLQLLSGIYKHHYVHLQRIFSLMNQINRRLFSHDCVIWSNLTITMPLLEWIAMVRLCDNNKNPAQYNQMFIDINP